MLREVNLDLVRGERLLVSASSRDDEFRTLLTGFCRTSLEDPYKTVTVQPHGRLRLDILNGGFPANFDREKEWESTDDIQLTRSLLYAGVIQALLQTPCESVRELDNEIAMLDPEAQRQIVGAWRRGTGDRLGTENPVYRYLDNKDWWRGHSTEDTWQSHIQLFSTSKYHLHFTTRKALDRMRQHVAPYVVRVYEDGKKRQWTASLDDAGPGSVTEWKTSDSDWKIIVYPGVWSPCHDWSCLFHIEKLPYDLRGKDFLEVGCGCGIISLAAAFKQARSVSAVDISECAVRNTSKNFELHGLTGCRYCVYESDIFSAVPKQKYDVILFNAPYHGSIPQDLLEMSVADGGYDGRTRFLAEIRDFLKPNGRVVLGASTSGDITQLAELLRRYNLKIVENNGKPFADERNGYNCQLYCLQPEA